MEHHSITSLIITYNSERVIANLLTDLRQANPGGPVIVIDNASTDQTVETISCQFPEVRLVQNRQNLGYASAVNQGVEMSETDYVFILNPDIRIPSAKVVHDLVHWLEASAITGAVGPAQYMNGKHGLRLNFICSYWSWRAFGGYLYYQIHHRWPAKNPIKVPMLNAGCIMVRQSAFIQVGKMNPKYFLYGEDPDLGMKFRYHGYDSWLLPDVAVIHLREESLRSLSLKQRSRVLWQAIFNISDALISGWWLILSGKIRPKKAP